MSENTVEFNNGQQLQVNTDLSKVFLGENEYKTVDFVNSTYDTIALPAGTAMMVDAATNTLVVLESAVADGTEFVGILGDDYSIEEGETKSLYLCIQGDVRKDMVALQGSDTLTTVIGGKTIQDMLSANSAGIVLVPSRSQTDYDNAL